MTQDNFWDFQEQVILGSNNRVTSDHIRTNLAFTGVNTFVVTNVFHPHRYYGMFCHIRARFFSVTIKENSVPFCYFTQFLWKWRVSHRSESERENQTNALFSSSTF